MKVNKSITITELRCGMQIEKVKGGYLIEFPPTTTLTAEELTEIRDAINLMLEEEPAPAAPSRGASAVTGPWDRLNDVPADVTLVIDKAGDRVWMKDVRSWDQKDKSVWDKNWAPYRLPEPGEE